MCFGLPEDETLFLCGKNVDVDDFSSDKFQQSASVVLKTCQVFHTLITNAFEEYHAQANFSVFSFLLSSGEEPWGQRGQRSVCFCILGSPFYFYCAMQQWQEVSVEAEAA